MSKKIVASYNPRPENSPLKDVKHIIAVASGKGGVGKSTTAVNLALALKKLGAEVGIMDSDIYGPSVPQLLGTDIQPTRKEGQKIEPPTVHGIKVMSMALLGGDAPAVWRGPMASKAVNQFLGDVAWGKLDYLILDLPPGTGDIHITISQTIKLSGAVIVMTPQVLAVDIAKRGLKMFQQVRVPIIGLVENMSTYNCPHCKKDSHIFQNGGAARVSEDLHLPVLASMPLDPEIVHESDIGKPTIINRPDSESSKKYLQMAESMVLELEKMHEGSREVPYQIVNIEPNSAAKILKLIWNDGEQSLVTFKNLRYLCPCAACVDENTGKRRITQEDIDPNVHPQKVESIGNYAIKVFWSDGHDTGIYSYDYLRKSFFSKNP